MLERNSIFCRVFNSSARGNPSERAIGRMNDGPRRELEMREEQTISTPLASQVNDVVSPALLSAFLADFSLGRRREKA